MPVTRQQLEEALELVSARTANPRAGLYGPGSMTWRLNRESIVFLGGGRAALLQAAHPFVAHAVVDHSRTKQDLPGRFQRTFLNVFEMVFGDLERAIHAGRRVHHIHQHIRGTIPEDVGRFPRGTRYQANDEGSLMWVYATLIDTAVQVHELVLGPVSPEDKDTFLHESRLFALLFGIPERLIPPGWQAFQDYMSRMMSSDTLAVGNAASDICHFLLRPPNRAVAGPWRWYRTITAGLLPPRLRHEYGFRWGHRQRLLFRASVAAAGRAYKRVPRRMRYLPPYVDARRRLDGKPGRDLYGRIVERAVLAGLARSEAAA